MDLPLWARVEKTVHGVETDSLVNKGSQMQQSIKKVMLIVFWDMKWPLSIDFLDEGTTKQNSGKKNPFIYWMTTNTQIVIEEILNQQPDYPHIQKNLTIR